MTTTARSRARISRSASRPHDMTDRLIYGSCVAVEGIGVLLLGDSGSGKSDLALRLIDEGALLVADDQVALDVGGGELVASAPREIAGRIEVRGIGIVDLEAVAEAPLRLAVQLVPADAVPRLPEESSWKFLGMGIPLIFLAPFEASATAKVRLAVRGLNKE